MPTEVMVVRRSELRADADTVWAAARTMEGVNVELGPWIRMGVPTAARRLSIDAAPLGREAFASPLFALGVVPFDLHHLTLAEIHEHGFVEESWSWAQKRWRHEREIAPRAGGGCTVDDRVTVVPRLPVSRITRALVGAIFDHRHRVLRARFGDARR